MEYKYYRELKHNYLIARDCGLDKTNCDSYSVRIVKNGNLKGFVPCDIRTINNEYFLYYEINSLQSIKDRYASKGMGLQELIRLFSNLKKALEGLSEYLLGIENIVLDAGSIFTDLSTGEFYFLYCPFGNQGKDFASFVDELFDLVDHEDEAAVEMVYTCSESAQVDAVLVLDLVKKMAEGKKNVEPKAEKIQIQEPEEPSEDYPSIDYEDESLDEDYQVPDKSEKKRAVGKRDLSGKAQILFAFLFFGLLASMVFIRMNFILSDEENILSVIVMLVSAVTGIVAFLSGVKDYTSGTKKLFSKKNRKAEMESDSEDEDTDDIDLYDNEDAEEHYREMPVNTWEDYDYPEENIDIATYKKPISISSGLKNADQTVVLNMEDEGEREFTLYSRNTDKTLRICLGKLPLTIGKMEGCVDNVISDKSISRIHCRFSKNADGRILLRDLNSTNGTFKNGLRLTPQEDSFIEEGDEVRIGRICFDCR